ncbi:AT-rich interaction domain 6 [Betta splendens]|uniref:AT-rich interaction domain 6 n=1 Tax=Betta splendens TaxID=158456 RepID=A0A6P7P1K3_BETSP|nr:AT-rich interaction domain 6 [Betta splendens]
MIHAKQMDMEPKESPGEKSKDPAEEITEEQFLKDLYLFMKKRDTPIERIPHLGFKQIDLFLMFNTVKDLGGYHQVTAQQLWKQVYNTLGGNPRSTSAATCTRRHYEKLLLPYECHVKGIMMSPLPQHQPKHFGYGYDRHDDADDRPPAAKRKLIPVSLPQSLYHPKAGLHGKIFPMPVPYPHYYPPSPAILPPYVPMTPRVMPRSPPAPKPESPFASSNPKLSSDSGEDSLKHLRELADKYKKFVGLEEPAEPLDLSPKASSQESNNNPVSSFSPPLPKFFNKPPPMYPSHPLQAERSSHGTPDSGAVSPYSHPEEVKDAYMVDVTPASNSPTYSHTPTLRTEDPPAARAQKPSSPKTDFQSAWSKEETEEGADVKRVDLSHILPSLPPHNGGKMEIEIPLSVLHKWLRMYQMEPSAAARGPLQLSVQPSKDEQAARRRFPQPSPGAPSAPSPRDRSPDAEDLRLRRRKVPTPPQTTHRPDSDDFAGCRSSPSGGTVRSAFGRGVYSAEQPGVMKPYTKPPSYWGAFEAAALKTNSGPGPFPQDYRAYRDGRSGRERSEVGPSTLLMVDSIPGSVLQLTSEEIMKLKKMISSSA